MLKAPKKTQKVLLIALITLLILSAPLKTKAGISDVSFSGIATSAFVGMNSIFISVVGNILAFAVNAFTWIIQWQSFDDVPVVTTTWTIVRDFMNMFFILILIIISFGTILGLQNYSITTPGLVSRLIMAALLINFSLVIGGFIIDVSNVFVRVFLNTMGDFAGNLGAGLSLNTIFKVDELKLISLGSVSFDKIIETSARESIFILIIVSILTFSMLAAAIFSFIRIPILWALLIVSPAAWVLGILPFSKNASQKWWNYFLGWTFFLPAYLFMLVIGTTLLKNRQQIDPLLASFQGSDTFFSTINFGVQDLFYWVLAVFVLVFGLKASLSFGSFASSGAASAFGASKGWLERRMGVSAIREGVGQVAKGVKEEGVPSLKIGGYQPFRGEQGEREKAAKVAGTLGRPIGFKDEFKIQQDFISNANKTFETLKRQFSIGKISDQDLIKMYKKSPTSQTGFAAAKMLADEGILQGNDFLALSKDLMKNNPLAMQDLTKTWSSKDFSGAQPNQLLGVINAGKTDAYSDYKDYAGPEALPIRKEFILKIADEKANKDMLKRMDVETLETAINILRGPQSFEGKRILKEVAAQRPDLMALYNQRNPREGVKQRDTMPERIYDAIGGKGAKDLFKVSKGVWKTDDFKKALQLAVDTLERSEKTFPPAQGKKGKKGGGLRFKENLKRQALLSGDEEKFNIANALIIEGVGGRQ